MFCPERRVSWKDYLAANGEQLDMVGQIGGYCRSPREMTIVDDGS